MKKVTITLFIILIMSTLISACSDKNTEKSFKSEREAIQYGMKTTANITRIIGESQFVKNEKIVVYLIKSDGDDGISSATLTHKGKRVTWTTNGNPFVVRDRNNEDTEGSMVFNSPSGRKYELYAGVAHGPHPTFNTQYENDVTPNVDKKSNIYYYVMLHHEK
ncbi:hypothetical protein [Marininema halotolerans]|uniref:Lipoprotein n=1 Tax=Marininema halotolerans TaxID=1155944 RepID=A0A1I6PYD6_9BACL|nr:hypothetical protein [Marininema halotolerans]SFS45194.1 hypothetical protein SAMN05444972_102219 [Marininema halotolerans]